MRLDFATFVLVTLAVILCWARLDRSKRGMHISWLLDVAANRYHKDIDELRMAIHSFLYLFYALAASIILLAVFGGTLWRDGLPLHWEHWLWFGVAFLAYNSFSGFVSVALKEFKPNWSIYDDFLEISWIKDALASNRPILRVLIISAFDGLFFCVVMLAILLQNFENIAVVFKFATVLSAYLLHQLLKARNKSQAAVLVHRSLITAGVCISLGFITENVLLAILMYSLSVVLQIKMAVQNRNMTYLRTSS